MAKFFNPKMKRLLVHSLGQFVVVLILFATTIALSFVEDFCRRTDRPAWMTNWVEWLSICLAIADGISLLSICLIVPYRLFREFLNEAGEA